MYWESAGERRDERFSATRFIAVNGAREKDRYTIDIHGPLRLLVIARDRSMKRIARSPVKPLYPDAREAKASKSLKINSRGPRGTKARPAGRTLLSRGGREKK